MRNSRLPMLLLLGLLPVGAFGALISDVRNTKHNLSSTGTGSVRATSQDQVCVFCHTPHSATSGMVPLWNKAQSGATYTRYTSSSLDANYIADAIQNDPAGSSKLCLSCHDGTLAMGNVNVLNGQGSATVPGTVAIPMTGGSTIPAGAGVTTGYTRNLGINLTNDHPISVSYTNTLSTRDAGLRTVDGAQKWPADGSIVGVRGANTKPKLPLEPTGPGNVGQVQCGTCHDPHIRDDAGGTTSIKFLRLHRFQQAQPTGTFNANTDMICLGCHDKDKNNASWAYSAHAHQNVADETYKAAASTRNEFPAGLPVWRAACLNCHDSHSVQGSTRLLREGTNSGAIPKAGGSASQEETCYQCHREAANSVVNTATGSVPDIRSDFQLARRMPINSDPETHDIGGNFSDAGFVDCSTTSNGCGNDTLESREKLGLGNLSNRHAECSDCHNPHRVIRNANGLPGALTAANTQGARTHSHTATHTNIISGALRGTWGVEPVYTSTSFHAMPSSFIVKRGDPGSSASTAVTEPYVTREYQVCLKCHSNYGYSDNNVYPTGNRPNLGYAGGTPSGTNALTQYTNQAKEYQSPVGHRGEGTATGANWGVCSSSACTTNNHRSWHPVMDITGRTNAIRVTSASNWLAPWSAVGTQTMYCTDCHGNNVTTSGSVVPTGSNPWGPHGSTNNFLLKSTWSNSSKELCYKCHNSGAYQGGGSGSSGFGGDSGWSGWGGGDDNLHNERDHQPFGCNACHVAVPHGWKNKQLLVNLNDVGPEAGLPVGTSVSDNYTRQPYYLNARLRLARFATSGGWSRSDCSGSCNRH